VSSALRASACTAAIAACSVYGPKRRDRSARSTSAAPSAIRSRSQRDRSWVLDRDQVAGRRRARGLPRFVQQHQRQEAHRLGLGQQLDEQASEPDRLAR
jgi:hypothetical protein